MLPVLALACGAAQAHAHPATASGVKRVLIVNSYEQGFIWTDAIVSALRETIEADATPVELWVEYLDVRRSSGADHLDRMLELIRNKAMAAPFDVVVATDDTAVALVTAHADTVFAGRPIVACGINDPTLATRLPHGAAALVERADPSRLLVVAQQLLPEIRRFFVVTDNTRTGASVSAVYQAYAPTRADLTFVFLDGGERSLDDVLATLRQAGRGDAVLISNFVRDRDHYYPHGTALQQVAAAAGAPVLSPIMSELGQGVMVGVENRGAMHGAWAGRQVLRALQNLPPPATAEIEPAGRIVADVQALARWGVDRRRLPADAMLVNEPSSFYRANEGAVWTAVALAALQAVAIVVLATNVVRRRRAEQALRARTEHLEQTLAALEQARVERVEIEERMRQGERLEAMGRLAGGIAHDFNNLLTVILSYAEVSAAAAPPQSELAGNLEQIRLASTSAADLTRQILAFSRRQVLSPAMVNLNELVEESCGLIRRLLSESIEISQRLQPGLPAIRIDRTQLQQVLINLSVNARDAMPGGGRLVIDTTAMDVDAAYTAAHPTMQPGYYVVLSVTDTGSGMPREVLDHIFDPFFTTKPKGRGTGLGLASVYGTVKQSGGWIWAYSEVGQGTTFKIHFPVTTSGTQTPPRDVVHSPTADLPRVPVSARSGR